MAILARRSCFRASPSGGGGGGDDGGVLVSESFDLQRNSLEWWWFLVVKSVLWKISCFVVMKHVCMAFNEIMVSGCCVSNGEREREKVLVWKQKEAF